MTLTLPENDANHQGVTHALLFERYNAMLYRLALRYLADRMPAEDAVAEAFIKIFKALPRQSFEHETQLEAWMCRIVINEALTVLRRQKRLHWVPEIAAVSVPIEPTCLHDLSMADIEACINSLPEGYRTVFNLYVIDGYKHSEIAALLQVSEGTSKSQLHKARQLIQQKITDRYS
jgi:RNA polymerase sigma factor (sigma-70 family)